MENGFYWVKIDNDLEVARLEVIEYKGKELHRWFVTGCEQSFYDEELVIGTRIKASHTGLLPAINDVK